MCWNVQVIMKGVGTILQPHLHRVDPATEATGTGLLPSAPCHVLSFFSSNIPARVEPYQYFPPGNSTCPQGEKRETDQPEDHNFPS